MNRIQESWHTDPSEEEIARKTAEIRERWSDRELLSRSGCRAEKVSVQTVTIERQSPKPAQW